MKSIRLENISKSYSGKEKLVVRNASFVAEPGEFVILVGPSGCGKTTILKLIAGLEEISSGELFFGERLMNDTEPRDRNIGMVFQNYALYPHLNVFDNIAFPLMIQKEKLDVIKSKVEETAQILGLEDYLSKKPKQLSGGQRQRVALGRAIVRKPDVFLFDEPLSNLDSKLRVQMRSEIVNLHRISGATSIYVTHDQTEAMTMGTKLIVMNNGVIHQIGTPIDVYNKPVDIFTATFLGSPEINIFYGEIFQDSGIFFRFDAGGTVLELTKSMFEESPITFGKVSLGIRPEYVVPVESDVANSFRAEIFNIEFLGHEQVIYFHMDGIKSSRITNIEKQYRVGDSIIFRIILDGVLIFNEAGQRK